MTTSSEQKLRDMLERGFDKDKPLDEAARAVLARMAETDRRITEIRENVKRGIRKPNGRFRL
jgi:hypothetical protein